LIVKNDYVRLPGEIQKSQGVFGEPPLLSPKGRYSGTGDATFDERLALEAKTK
jgi:hypothetical protein